jgi:hypothetical protein
MAADKGVTIWNRLEPRPRTRDFDRTLRAEIRDPLWILTRQWQFGEFKAEDTGTAIFSRVDMETTKVTKISMRGNNGQAIDTSIPLEAEVEREQIPLDTGMRLEIGTHWNRMLRKRLAAAGASAAEIASIQSDFKNAVSPLDLSFTVPAEDEEHAALFSNRKLWEVTSAIAHRRTIDGSLLIDYIKEAPSNKASNFVTSNTNYNTLLNTAGADLVDWFERVYAQPTGSEEAWDASHLEYQFAASAPETNGTPSVLIADEYYQGKMDWFSFDFEMGTNKYHPDLDTNPESPGDIVSEQFTVIPTEIQYSGMPNSRWWAMEDRQVDFGNLEMNTTDTTKLLIAEFGLMYSNDWSIIPYSVPVGSISDVKSIVVTDVFGVRTKIKPAGEQIVDPFGWSMYGLNTRMDTVQSLEEPDNRIFIPPVVHKPLESKPVEAVNFIRDEMANMVWGVETFVPNGFGQGVEGHEAALAHVRFLQTVVGAEIPNANLPNDAEIQYLLQKGVPENWIPFIPVKLDPSITARSIRLQRAAMPREIDGLDDSRVRPRTELLRFGVVDPGEVTEAWSPYYIYEEEVPRSGAVVTRTWQRARTEDGSVVVWLGRRKSNGRGERSSGLAFDTLGSKSAEELPDEIL